MHIPFWKQNRLSRFLMLYIILCSLFFIFLITAIQLKSEYQKDIKAIHTTLESIQSNHLPGLASSTFELNTEQLGYQLQILVQLKDIHYAEIYEIVKGEKRTIINFGDETVSRDVIRNYPLKHIRGSGKSKIYGHLLVVASYSAIHQRLWEQAFVVSKTNGLGIFLLGISILLIIQLMITRHINAMLSHTKQLDLENLNQKLILQRRIKHSSKPDELDMLASAINTMQARLIAKTRENEKTKEALLDSEKLYRSLVENINIGITLVDQDHNIIMSNSAQGKMFCQDKALFTGKNCFKAFAGRDEICDDCPGLTAMQEGYARETTARWQNHDDGSFFFVKIRAFPIQDEHGFNKGFIEVVEDITEQRQTEEALRRSQKMDAIGQMAGGIAHDFNNILGIIIGNLSLLKRMVINDDKALKRIDTANKAAQRAADLTKQLLGFSRQQSEQAKPTDINRVIRDMDSLLIRSVTPEVEVELQLKNNLWLTDIDSADFEDAVLNLTLNARDAMPMGGKLTVETSNKILDAAYAKMNPAVTPGEYVEFSLNDTGIGMTADEQEHVFEPFFSTKPRGKGTGLGLSMVFGFIQRSKGHIKIYSEVGIGTTFRCYLPRSTNIHEEQRGFTIVESQLPEGQETVLVVDDEEALLSLAQEYLTMRGYTVFTASTGKQALQIIEKQPEIDLLFSDIVMPGGINGYELAEQAVILNPQLKVLLTSGYSSKTLSRNGQARFKENLLRKPYNHEEIATKVRFVLDN